MKEGTFVYSPRSERMDIRFGMEEYYGGLHCGEFNFFVWLIANAILLYLVRDML